MSRCLNPPLIPISLAHAQLSSCRCVELTVIPSNGDSAPSSSDDRAKISCWATPAYAVADSKKSGLFAGHRSYFPRRPILKSPIRFPDLSCAVSHFGRVPRPDQRQSFPIAARPEATTQISLAASVLVPSPLTKGPEFFSPASLGKRCHPKTLLPGR